MPDLDLKIEKVPIDSITINPRNPRKIEADQFEKLKKSIIDYPKMILLRPLILNAENQVVGGNMRLLALRELGYKEVPIVRDVSMTPEEQRQFVIKDNLSFGIWDYEILGADYDLEELERYGYDPKEFDNFGRNKETEEVPEASNPPAVAQAGDVFQLGDHRLMCGDSTKITDWDKLMQGEKAQLIFTDPPYNVDYKSQSGRSYSSTDFGGDGSKIFNDNKSDEDCLNFYIDVLKNLYSISTDDASIYWWLAFNINNMVNLLAFLESGWKMSQMIIWVKEQMVFSLGQDYHRLHEPCFYGWKEGNKHYSNKKIANLKDVFSLSIQDFSLLQDIWYEQRDKTAEYIHPTQKPVRLAERAIKKNSRIGDIVVDAFNGSGSGSGLIACQQLERKYRGMELDPKFVDATIARWEIFTNQKAIKL